MADQRLANIGNTTVLTCILKWEGCDLKLKPCYDPHCSNGCDHSFYMARNNSRHVDGLGLFRHTKNVLPNANETAEGSPSAAWR